MPEIAECVGGYPPDVVVGPVVVEGHIPLGDAEVAVVHRVANEPEPIRVLGGRSSDAEASHDVNTATGGGVILEALLADEIVDL